MTISRHLYALEVLGTGHRVSATGGEVTLDESWSPYVQGTVQIPLPAQEVLDAIDPRVDARVRLTLRCVFGEPWPVSALTADVGGSVAASTAAGAGSVAAVTARYARPYNLAGMRPSTRRRLNLGVRSRPVDRLAGTVVLTLASDEALMQDYGLVSTVAIAPDAPTVREAVLLVLSRVGGVLAPGAQDAAIEADAAAWTPGTSGWDYLTPLVQAAGLRLWCDEGGAWQLTQPLAPAPGALAFSTSTNLTRLEDTIDRDAGLWYDAVVVIYRWRDGAGTEQTRYDVAGLPRPRRTYTVTFERPFPGPGAAAALLARARGRGRVYAPSAVSDYSATPGQVATITAPGAPIQTGMASRVSWSLDEDTMQVRTRDLIDTPTTAWVFLPAGQSWLDSPVGESWLEEETHG
ncbi:hypothetical protein ACFWGN_04275 [Oerskovia sp. NPDC060338]|uniref:hypothetical protein n=1 Tax=Oerskovia sp. NPDC060338 TaxID=3347100 RepID=UPI003655942A